MRNCSKVSHSILLPHCLRFSSQCSVDYSQCVAHNMGVAIYTYCEAVRYIAVLLIKRAKYSGVSMQRGAVKQYTCVIS